MTKSIEDVYAFINKANDLAVPNRPALMKALSSPDVRQRADESLRAMPGLSGPNFVQAPCEQATLLVEVAWLWTVALNQLLEAGGDLTGFWTDHPIPRYDSVQPPRPMRLMDRRQRRPSSSRRRCPDYYCPDYYCPSWDLRLQRWRNHPHNS